jgi:hypothetical protein
MNPAEIKNLFSTQPLVKLDPSEHFLTNFQLTLGHHPRSSMRKKFGGANSNVCHRKGAFSSANPTSHWYAKNGDNNAATVLVRPAFRGGVFFKTSEQSKRRKTGDGISVACEQDVRIF